MAAKPVKNAVITARFSPKNRDRIKEYANEFYSGSMSSCVADLAMAGLDRKILLDSFREEIHSIVEKEMENLARITSRGTKASLANFVFNSTFTYPIAMCIKELGSMIEDGFSQQRIDVSSGGFHSSINGFNKWQNMNPSAPFNYCWEAGGKIQQAGTKAEYYTAIKDLKITEDKKPEESKYIPENWEIS